MSFPGGGNIHPELDSSLELFWVDLKLLTRLASWTDPDPTEPFSSSGLNVMDLSVFQVVLGLKVVVQTASGFLALMRRSTSHTCGLALPSTFVDKRAPIRSNHFRTILLLILLLLL